MLKLSQNNFLIKLFLCYSVDCYNLYTMNKILFITLLVVTSGCSIFSKDDEDPTRNWTVERLYREAKDALESKSYNKAVQLYEFLETRFPFGVYGQQSLLDLTYAYYKIGDHDSSIISCDRFIRLYPQNPHVDYAYYLRGLVNYNRRISITDRIVRTDSSQRDTSNAYQAFRDFSELLEKFPDSQYAEDAIQRMVYLRNLLAQNEIHIAQYYLRRNAYIAAVNRARYVVRIFPRTPSIPDALIIMSRAYKILGMDDLSEDTLRILEMNYPEHPGINIIRRVVIK